MSHRPAVAVVGSGLMARGIVAACADAGLDVVIVARDVGRANAIRPARSEGSVDVVDLAGVEPIAAEFVIETVVEDLAVKHEVLATIEARIPPSIPVATNTSSLTVAAVSDGMKHPSRCLAMHFLNPADITGLVEIAPGPTTSTETIDRARALAVRLGKRALLVEDVPGFLWNRLQFALLRECTRAVETGLATAEEVDLAISFGLAPRWMAMGPLGTAELGGRRTFARIAEEIFPHLDCSATVPPVLCDGDPFYDWDEQEIAAISKRRQELLLQARSLWADPNSAVLPRCAT